MLSDFYDLVGMTMIDLNVGLYVHTTPLNLNAMCCFVSYI